MIAKARSRHASLRAVSLRVFMMVLAMMVTLPMTSQAAEDVYTQRTLDLARKLECPVCNGQTVADSHSGTAREMRNVIEQKVLAGESDDAIIAYFVDRFGEEILAEPPKSGFTLTLWWAPVGMVLFGLVVVLLFLRERTARAATATATATANTGGTTLDPELERLARETLAPTDDHARGATRPERADAR